MDDRNITRQDWLTAAVAGVRFQPDRKAVEREFWEHIEDKTADLMRIFPDMTAEEAEARALSGMGDPEEVARELAKVHKPWLGWLWKASQVALKASLVALVLQPILVVGMGGDLGGWYNRWDEAPLCREELVVLEPDRDRVSVDGDWVTMERAVLDRERDRVGVKLRVYSPAFWERGSGNLMLHSLVTAVDDRGNYHPSYTEFWAEGLSVGERPINYVNPDFGGHGLCHRDYIFWVQEVDPEAKWVRLEYDWLGRRFDFTIDLTEEAEA